MKQRTEIIGAHVFFAREGAVITTPEAGTVSRTSKPDAADPIWSYLGVGNVKFSPKREEHEVWKPSPGRKQLDDVISYKRGLDLTLHMTEIENLVFELFLGTKPLPNSPAPGGQFNPFVGEDVRGWIKIQTYDRDDAILLSMDAYAYLKPEGDLDPQDGPVECDITARVLKSPLNTGELK